MQYCLKDLFKNLKSSYSAIGLKFQVARQFEIFTQLRAA